MYITPPTRLLPGLLLCRFVALEFAVVSESVKIHTSITKMKLLLVGACVLFLSLPAAGLKCYDCLSTKSWDDCKGTSKDCIGGADRCAKVYFKAGSSEVFAKYCTLSALCSKEKNPTCKNAIGSFECDISCCDGDNCNAGSTSRISGILLLTCALASLMILVKA